MKNNYSKFITVDEMQKELKKVSSEKEVSKGGIPLCYDESSIYLDETTGHNLVIGSTGSGKTQSVILPKVYTSILAGENLVIDDPKSQIYEIFKDDLNNMGYKVIKLDFHEFNGNKWNPLKLAYNLYKDNKGGVIMKTQSTSKLIAAILMTVLGVLFIVLKNDVFRSLQGAHA